MPKKKTTQTKKSVKTIKIKEEIKKEGIKKKESLLKEKYFYAVGRRKTSVVQVKMVPSEKAGENNLIINKKKMREYFPLLFLQNLFLAPLKATGNINRFKITAVAKGGGIKGQAEAARLAISRALVKFNEEYKKSLRDLGYLTCDARVVERKKAGLKKARRAPQWAKR